METKISNINWVKDFTRDIHYSLFSTFLLGLTVSRRNLDFAHSDLVLFKSLRFYSGKQNKDSLNFGICRFRVVVRRVIKVQTEKENLDVWVSR